MAWLAAIAILERFPEIGEEVQPGICKILLRRFPYKLIYSVTNNAEYGRTLTYTKGDKIESGVLKNFIVDLDLVFTD